jgi:hypothetical protein
MGNNFSNGLRMWVLNIICLNACCHGHADIAPRTMPTIRGSKWVSYQPCPYP